MASRNTASTMIIKFLKNSIRFIILFYGSLLLVVFLSNYSIQKNADFKLPNTINKIVMGHSQPECAFNDSLISNFKNLSKSAETYFYSYQKLKSIIKHNPQIKTVFIEFNPVNILVREDEKIWTDRYINHHLPNYFSFLDLQDHKLLGSKNMMGYHHAGLKSVLTNFNRIVLNHYHFIDSIGGYKHLTRQNTKELSEITPNNVINQKHLKPSELSTYDIVYLEKMIQLCQENNIEVYLIRSPYHQQFEGNAYEKGFLKVKQDRFKDIPFLDFKDFPLGHKDFADLQHLNYKGAAKFSKWFNTWLDEQKLK